MMIEENIKIKASALKELHVQERQNFHRNYKLKNKVLGMGHFYYVRKAINNTNNKGVNVKCIFYRPKRSLREIMYLLKLYYDHNVIRLIDFFHCSSNTVFIITEHFSNITLYQFLKDNISISEHVIHVIFKQIVNVIHVCTKKYILHMQITSHKILIKVSSLQIKLIDFHSACEYNNCKLYTKEIKHAYTNAPPEWFLFKHYTGNGVISWSLGIILYRMLYNKKPFYSPIQIVKCPCVCPLRNNVSLTLLTLLKWCLEKKVQNRITLHELVHHPWITRVWI